MMRDPPRSEGVECWRRSQLMAALAACIKVRKPMTKMHIIPASLLLKRGPRYQRVRVDRFALAYHRATRSARSSRLGSRPDSDAPFAPPHVSRRSAVWASWLARQAPPGSRPGHRAGGGSRQGCRKRLRDEERAAV